MSERLYYIKTKGFVGNDLLWWRPNRGGYTANLSQAGKYSAAEALEIMANRPKEDVAYWVSDVDKRAILVVTDVGGLSPLKLTKRV